MIVPLTQEDQATNLAAGEAAQGVDGAQSEVEEDAERVLA